MRLCEVCHEVEASVRLTDGDMVNRYCMDCFSDINARELGIAQEVIPEEIIVQDFQGVRRHFNVVKRILPNDFFLEAEEGIQYGYHFAVHGAVDVDQQLLFQQLHMKVKQGVSKQYLTEETFPMSATKYLQMSSEEMVGRISSSEDYDPEPLLIIDGKPISWEELGKVVLGHEGFQFKLTIKDITDEIEE